MNKKKLPDKQIAVYQMSNGSINIEVLCANENIWLSQKRIAELFGCSSDNIFLHIKNTYREKKLNIEATTEEFSVVQQEGKLNAFLKFSEFEILTNVGSISYEVVKQLALREYVESKKKQDAECVSDFDQLIRQLPKEESKQ